MPEQFDELMGTVLVSTPGGYVVSLGQLSAVILLLIVGYIGSRFVGYLLGRKLAMTAMRPDIIFILKRVAFFTILVLVVISALALLGIPLTAFAFATGALAIGVGFGAQNIINNFISGWILMVERPIRIQDFIEIDNVFGVVEEIGTRSTRIRRTDGVHMLVPNSALLERTVVNWTLVDDNIRTTVRVGVAYGSPARKVAELILQAVVEHPDVNEEPEPQIVFEEFGDNALVFDALFWCHVGGERLLRVIRSEVRFRISELFEEANIVIAFPQRDVHLDTSRPLEIRMLDTDDEAAAK